MRTLNLNSKFVFVSPLSLFQNGCVFVANLFSSILIMHFQKWKLIPEKKNHIISYHIIKVRRRSNCASASIQIFPRIPSVRVSLALALTIFVLRYANKSEQNHPSATTVVFWPIGERKAPVLARRVS